MQEHCYFPLQVNNAGILEFGSIEQTSLEQYDRVMGMNVRSMYHLTMLAVPHLILSQGNIVNVSSVNGIRSVRTSLISLPAVFPRIIWAKRRRKYFMELFKIKMHSWTKMFQCSVVASCPSLHIRLKLNLKFICKVANTV